ncbi:MAG: hypothetical protein ABEJ02_02075, partial [Candidatus Paceibacteria bacterium]
CLKRGPRHITTIDFYVSANNLSDVSVDNSLDKKVYASSNVSNNNSLSSDDKIKSSISYGDPLPKLSFPPSKAFVKGGFMALESARLDGNEEYWLYFNDNKVDKFTTNSEGMYYEVYNLKKSWDYEDTNYLYITENPAQNPSNSEPVLKKLVPVLETPVNTSTFYGEEFYGFTAVTDPKNLNLGEKFEVYVQGHSTVSNTLETQRNPETMTNKEIEQARDYDLGNGSLKPNEEYGLKFESKKYSNFGNSFTVKTNSEGKINETITMKPSFIKGIAYTFNSLFGITPSKEEILQDGVSLFIKGEQGRWRQFPRTSIGKPNKMHMYHYGYCN